jgi:hypothetical protein
VADAMSEPLRLTIVYEDASDGDGWVVAPIPQVRGAISPSSTSSRDRQLQRFAVGAVWQPASRWEARSSLPNRKDARWPR